MRENEERPHAIAPKRCLAKTRKGTPCQSFVVKGRNRCRLHGGAAGSGAQKGNKNALKHGRYTQKAIAERRTVKAFLRKFKENLKIADEI